MKIKLKSDVADIVYVYCLNYLVEYILAILYLTERGGQVPIFDE